MEEKVLEVQHIFKSFPGVKALDDVSFSVSKGSIHALIGENGAGKSTLIKVLAGIYQPDGGTLKLHGKNVIFKTPHESQVAGIRVVHQELKLVNTLSVMENVFLGNLKYKNHIADWNGMRECAKNMLDSMGVAIDVNEIVENLSVAKQQIVEICKAINGDCNVLIMDEPSATITLKEQEVMFEVVRKLQKQGISIIYISHRLEEIFDLADEVTVLRDGKHIKTLPVNQVDRKGLITLMVGRELTNEYPKEKVKIGEMALEVTNLCRKGVLKNVSINVRKGEIIGIAGLVGAGRTETARAILGIDKIDSGKIVLYGKEIVNRSFRDAIRKGMGLVPEDRKKEGILPIMSVKNNISVVNMKKVIKNGIIQEKLEEKYADEYIKKLNISTPTMEAEVQYLSGGNQQKVIIGRWMLQNSNIIFMDEPTRGVDVGAKVEIYELMNEMVKQGKAIVMISSELPEILGMSDRIFVMHDGEMVGELSREEATQEGILALCI
ncbi:sugar ABC transporter ATP-binding protein [Robinsoniella peoriensis]|uniref:Ribose import ATP-binding protein RbsA n=1 Tax=Robinsoniella peoriensis TaxID=180332 RepID=A0A4U8Q286_9FIRM|nr:sugar ABC transporter ATP-binding protein [Robinsoniella peoriensis]MDU7030557.1 sugar ABC transporter ATP-binding protein [Clostridiales bacterium]TLC98428.1 Ribose import ATP-binding protein RbsA [Robinsoniella peoriensis]